MSLPEHYLPGKKKVKLNVSEPSETIRDTSFLASLISNNLKEEKETSVTVGSPLTAKKKIWKDKSASSKKTIQITTLSEILDQVSTSKEKVLSPFWTAQSKEMSTKLWLPTKIDCVDSVLSSSNKSLNSPMGKSWFSIDQKHPQKKNSLMTSFQLSQYSLPESMDSEAIPSKIKSGPQLKTMKFRLFPTGPQKETLRLYFDQFRWYYNAMVHIFSDTEDAIKKKFKKQYSMPALRKLLFQHSYHQERIDNITFQEFIFDEERRAHPIPDWWEDNVHSRIPRGAVCKFTSSLNSALSNLKNGNINKFKMNHRSKKKDDYVHFEDKHYPVFINQIKSHFWYRNKDHKRTTFAFTNIQNKKSLEIIYEKDTDRYFLHAPVERTFFPDDDLRTKRQDTYSKSGERVISLDPGIRKFLVGYDPSGSSIFIGDKASIKLTKLLLKIDKLISQNKSYQKEQRYVQNLVRELHWKTASFLVENYDIIFLPDFRVKQMVKGRGLSKIVKRLMMQFSFHQFKERLTYKCNMYGKKLLIVDESYTSCTCTNCGHINQVKGKEQLECERCDLLIDRDVAGSRNILIKNLTLEVTSDFIKV
jgi:IS605 OrfB family transposase